MDRSGGGGTLRREPSQKSYDYYQNYNTYSSSRTPQSPYSNGQYNNHSPDPDYKFSYHTYRKPPEEHTYKVVDDDDFDEDDSFERHRQASLRHDLVDSGTYRTNSNTNNNHNTTRSNNNGIANNNRTDVTIRVGTTVKRRPEGGFINALVTRKCCFILTLIFILLMLMFIVVASVILYFNCK